MSRRNLILAVLFAAPLAFGLAACGGGAEEEEVVRIADPSSVREIAQGELVGYGQSVDDGALQAQAWLGIPYAAPPVGDLRWRAARSHGGWGGRLEALEHPNWCPQVTNGLDSGYGYEVGVLMGDEDCLYLNIYAPAFEPEDVPTGAETLPVMVWIHGGGNTWGRAEQYDASTLAARENMIVVVIQYRLGQLGWMAHPALRETAELPIDRTANFGTFDMIASLLWVRENIGAFGGDADNVTIFGESAGGRNVLSLLAAPLAEGLFDRAIAQSGNTSLIPVAVAEGSAPDPMGRSYVNSADAINSILAFVAPPTDEQMAGAMRSIDVETLFAAYQDLSEGEFSTNPARVIADGIVLPGEGILAAMQAGRFNDVPVIAGTNRDETKLFNALDPAYTNRYFGVIIRARDPRMYDLVAEYQSLIWRVRGADNILSALAANGNDDVYGYRFDWDEEGSFLFTNYSRILGAAHSWEIPFIFANWDYAGRLDRVLWNDGNEEGRLALSDEMMGYWAAFARTGAPGDGHGDSPEWEPFDDGARIIFDTAADGGIRMEEGVLTTADVLAQLAADDRFDTDEERCTVYAAMVSWWPETATDDFLGGACEG